MTNKFKIRTQIYSLIIIISLSSCTIVEYDFGNDSQIVLNSFITTTEPVTAYLAESYTIGAPYNSVPVIIDNATIKLYEDGIEKTTLKHDNFGKYVSNYFPKENKEYTLEVDAPNYPSVKGKEQLPEKVTFNSFTYENKMKYIDTLSQDPFNPDAPPMHIKDSFLISSISLSFTDLMTQNSIYRITARKMDELKYNGTILYNKTLVPLSYWNISPIESWYTTYYFNRNYYCFYDSLNNGEEFEIKFELQINGITTYPIKLYIYLENLSERTVDYYDFLTDYFLVNSNFIVEDDNMNVDIMKTDDVPNNIPYIYNDKIENGYGFIGAASGVMDSIIIEERPK